MSEFEKELVFSQAVKAGKRIYYFDVKQTRNGERYISITESKKIVEGNADNPQFSFEKHKIFLYKEDYEKFLNAMISTLAVAKGGDIPAVQPFSKPAEAPAPAPVETAPVVNQQPAPKAETASESYKIDLDF